ncbi:helicase-related protein [Treponema sp. R6D11]
MISFKPETIDFKLMADMLDSQSAVGVTASDRDKAAEKERIQTKLGRATKAGDRQTNWEDTGFDHITVDELHNFKNIFSQAKGKEKTSKEEGNANEFTKITGGTPSDQALKLFAITQMVQRVNNGRNVFGLTATPFTNSPIEIYNILSLVAREKLKETGIYNLHEFMAQFAALKSELAVDSQGDVAEKTVMKEFKNLVALQKLINTYIDKVDGEEAGVIRPKKSTHYEDCTLNMTLAQKDLAEQIIHYMDTADPKEDPGATLKGINALRQLALSPRLLEKSNIVTLPDDMGDFVTSSPKMTFVCDSAAELSKTAGQVIYLPQGISYYKEVKDYLVKRGVDPEAIAFLSPQHLPSGTNKDGSDRGEEEKARIMKDFNDPNGKIKIIIGSETIKEGVNLNGNTSTLYNCMLDWNPTDAIQVEGRIHRQGNKQGHVHIVYPLMNDSIDSFMYQKHDEKSKRIAAVFSYKGDTLNVEEINPEEAKFSLIKDPAKRAGMQIKQEIEVIKNQVLIAQATCDKIVENASRRREYQEEIKNCQKQIEQIKKAAKKISEMSDAELIREHGNKYREDDESIEERFDEFDGVKESSWVGGKNPKDFRKEYDRVSKAATQYLQKYITSAKSKSETVENTLRRYNVDPTNERSATEVASKFGKEAVRLKENIKKIESKRDEYIEKAKKQIAKEAKPGLTVAEATKLVTKDIAKNLRPMDEVKEEILAEREAKKNETVKKSVVFVIDSVIKVEKRA